MKDEFVAKEVWMDLPEVQERIIPTDMVYLFVHEYYGTVIGGSASDNLQEAKEHLEIALNGPHNKLLKESRDYISLYKKVEQGYHF